MAPSPPQEHVYIGISHQIGVNNGYEEPLGDDYMGFLNVGQDLPPSWALPMVDRGQKTVPTRSGAAEIIFPDMSHAPCPAVGIQTATQDAPTGQSFCMFLRPVLNEKN